MIKKLVITTYLIIVVLTLGAFKFISTGFIPDEDQGVLIASITLPDGASLTRTEQVARKFVDQVRDIDGVDEKKIDSIQRNGFC